MFGVSVEWRYGIGVRHRGRPCTTDWLPPGPNTMTSYFARSVGGVADGLRIDVVVGDLVDVERLAPPAFGLGVGPAVQDRDPGGAGRMHLDRRRRRDRVRAQPQLLRHPVEIARRHLGDDERAARELDPARLERLFGDLDVGILQRVAQRDQRVVRVVIHREGGALPEHAARRRDLPLHQLHRDVEHLDVGDADRLDGKALRKGPAGVVVGARLRLVRRPVLVIEQRVGDPGVRLIHPHDVAAGGEFAGRRRQLHRRERGGGRRRLVGGPSGVGIGTGIDRCHGRRHGRRGPGRRPAAPESSP